MHEFFNSSTCRPVVTYRDDRDVKWPRRLDRVGCQMVRNPGAPR
jgi:hypothetical protein